MTLSHKWTSGPRPFFLSLCMRPLVENLVKDNCSDSYHFIPHVCRPVPVVFTPLNSQMSIRLCNEGFMHCSPTNMDQDGKREVTWIFFSHPPDPESAWCQLLNHAVRLSASICLLCYSAHLFRFCLSQSSVDTTVHKPDIEKSSLYHIIVCIIL